MMHYLEKSGGDLSRFFHLQAISLVGCSLLLNLNFRAGHTRQLEQPADFALCPGQVSQAIVRVLIATQGIAVG